MGTVKNWIVLIEEHKCLLIKFSYAENRVFLRRESKREGVRTSRLQYTQPTHAYLMGSIERMRGNGMAGSCQLKLSYFPFCALLSNLHNHLHTYTGAHIYPHNNTGCYIVVNLFRFDLFKRDLFTLKLDTIHNIGMLYMQQCIFIAINAIRQYIIC